MGRYFNQKLMNTNLSFLQESPRKKYSPLEKERIAFNKEGNEQTLSNQTTKETGIAGSPGNGDESKPNVTLSPRRGRPRGTGRANKSNPR